MFGHSVGTCRRRNIASENGNKPNNFIEGVKSFSRARNKNNEAGKIEIARKADGEGESSGVIKKNDDMKKEVM